MPAYSLERPLRLSTGAVDRVTSIGWKWSVYALSWLMPAYWMTRPLRLSTDGVTGTGRSIRILVTSSDLKGGTSQRNARPCDLPSAAWARRGTRRLLNGMRFGSQTNLLRTTQPSTTNLAMLASSAVKAMAVADAD